VALNPDPRARLVQSLWFVAGAMAIHELEEWNIAEWGARNFTNHSGISEQAIWVGLAVITISYVSWIFVATRLRSPLIIAIVALPAVALIAVGNSVQHITWTLLFAEYAPGVVSAVVLVIPASIHSMWRMVRVHHLLVWPIGMCAVLWIAAVRQIIGAGHVMQPFQVILQQFFTELTKSLGLQG
jgi:hypothetical protein